MEGFVDDVGELSRNGTPHPIQRGHRWDAFFCDPKSRWQLGTNENTNGVLRQYFPKAIDMSKLTQAELGQAAYSINTRPRQTLNWKTPSDQLAEAVQRQPEFTAAKRGS